jgi:hypothetical protein
MYLKIKITYKILHGISKNMKRKLNRKFLGQHFNDFFKLIELNMIITVIIE